MLTDVLPNDLQNQFSHLTFPKTHSTLAVMKHCVSSHYVTYLLSDGNWSEAWRKWGRLPCCYGKCSPKRESTKFTCGLKWGKLTFIHWNGSSQLLLILAVHSTSIEWLLCGWQVVGTRAIGEIGKTEHLPQTHVLFFLFFLFLVGNSLFFSGEPWLIHLQYVRLSVSPHLLKKWINHFLYFLNWILMSWEGNFSLALQSPKLHSGAALSSHLFFGLYVPVLIKSNLRNTRSVAEGFSTKSCYAADQ